MVWCDQKLMVTNFSKQKELGQQCFCWKMVCVKYTNTRSQAVPAENYAVVKSVLIHLNHQCLNVGAGWCPLGAATADAAPENGVSVI